MVTEVDPIIESHEKSVRISIAPMSRSYVRHKHGNYIFPITADLLVIWMFNTSESQ